MKKIVLSAANRCININLNKKADLSINMIIIAVLGLLILVVLAFVFSNKINLFGKGVSNCAGQCTSDPIGQNGDPSGASLCEKLAEKDSKPYTYNPGGTCLSDTKTSKKACCILAYT